MVAMMKSSSTLTKVRRGSQISFFLFFLLLFFQAQHLYTTGLPNDLFLRFSPLVPLFDFIDSINLSLLFWPALVILLLTPFLGRFFCGWICPLGTTLDATSKVVRSPENTGSASRRSWRLVKYGLLLSLIILGVTSIHVWGLFDPLAIFYRALTVIINPIITFLTDTFQGLTGGESALSVPESTPFSGSGGLHLPDPQPHLHQILWIGLFFVTILGLEKISRRFWCRNLCPAGALLGFFSQFRFLERIVSKSCPECGKCSTTCKMNAIPGGDVYRTDKMECVECFACADTCPTKVKAIAYGWQPKPSRTAFDFSRRQFIATSFGSLATLGLLSIGIRRADAAQQPIRPPGALPESDFLDKCIRCEACVKVCQTSGACLQPDVLKSSLTGLWAPIAHMRGGYCDPSCNLCGQVCPTEAIQPFTDWQRQVGRIGEASVVEDRCIPFVSGDECTVCAEVCPVRRGAIRLQQRNVTLANGSTTRVRVPRVDGGHCIGCGVCEYSCPVPGEAGIIISARRVQNEFRPEERGIPLRNQRGRSV